MIDVFLGFVLVYDDLLDGWVSFLYMDEIGIVMGFNGYVDLGIGIEIVLVQIVVEELDLLLDCVWIVLGDIVCMFDQGVIIVFEMIQIVVVFLCIVVVQLWVFLLGVVLQWLNMLVVELQID